MNRYLYQAAFCVGLIAVGWVGVGYIGSNLLALTMTALIGAFYLMGALELRRFHQATRTLERALSAIPDQLPALGDWLGKLHASLQTPVRLRIEGGRSGLPGPAMTPYLAGLLVLLGMLGTFLGMAVTLHGTALALDSTTDLQAIRASLAAPVKGLGLAFGTSIAGVSASAMLGLMSALCRRERLQAAQHLDALSATALRAFTPARHREETLETLQRQARLMPELVESLQAMMARMERQSQQLNERLLAGQDGFHRNAEAAYSGLAASVGRSLQKSLAESARAAGATIQPVVESTMAGLAREASQLHERMADTVATRLDGLSASFQHHAAALVLAVDTSHADLQARLASREEQRLAAWLQSLESMAVSLQQAAAEAPRAAAEVIAQLRQKLSDSIVQDNQLLEERSRIMATLTTLLDAVNHAATEQRGAIDALVANSAALLDRIGSRFAETVDAESGRIATAATQITGSAVEVSSLGEAFGFGVQLFGESNDKLMAQLQRIEGSLAESSTRSGEQLAYYVAQAREIIDLSIMSQKQIIDDLQRLSSRQAVLAAEAG